ncbi:MAG: GntR family transcriptional regulator [Chloroflexi bacterium]|nr:GntR family transcriptional regulator [Chloroflexota bacterium]
MESLTLSAPFSRTLSDQVANQLRQVILQGRLKPGQRIVEHEIADAMAISRGPVRDALKILQNERLVVQYPHRGAFVAWLTLRDAEEIYSLREALESLALDYAIKYATDEQIAELDQVINQMTAQLQQDCTQTEATDLDLEFHHTLCRISGHSRVLVAWTALRAQVRLLILTHRILQPTDFRENGIEWHRRLVNAVRQRDTQVARRVLQDHLAASFESVATAIRVGKLEPPIEQ